MIITISSERASFALRHLSSQTTFLFCKVWISKLLMNRCIDYKFANCFSFNETIYMARITQELLCLLLHSKYQLYRCLKWQNEDALREYLLQLFKVHRCIYIFIYSKRLAVANEYLSVEQFGCFSRLNMFACLKHFASVILLEIL